MRIVHRSALRRGRAVSQGGFTLVELMVVVTIIAILGMIVVPNLGDYLHQTKMTKTLTDMNRVADAWMANGGFLRQGQWLETGENLDFAAQFPVRVTARELEAVLQTEVPEMDGWGNAIEYRVDALPPTCLAIRSANSDGQFEPGPYVVGTMIPMRERIRDIVRIDIRRIVWPDPIWRGIVIPPPGPVLPPF